MGKKSGQMMQFAKLKTAKESARSKAKTKVIKDLVSSKRQISTNKTVVSPKREASLNASAKLNIFFTDAMAISIDGLQTSIMGKETRSPKQSPNKMSKQTPTKSPKQIPSTNAVAKKLFNATNEFRGGEGYNNMIDDASLYERGNTVPHNLTEKAIESNCKSVINKEIRKRKTSGDDSDSSPGKFVRRVASLNAEAIMSATSHIRPCKSSDACRNNSCIKDGMRCKTISRSNHDAQHDNNSDHVECSFSLHRQDHLLKDDSQRSQEAKLDCSRFVNLDVCGATEVINSDAVSVATPGKVDVHRQDEPHPNVMDNSYTRIKHSVDSSSNPAVSVSSMPKESFQKFASIDTSSQNSKIHPQATIAQPPPPYQYPHPSPCQRFTLSGIGTLSAIHNCVCHQHCNATVPVACNHICNQTCATACPAAIPPCQHDTHTTPPMYGYVPGGYFQAPRPIIQTVPDPCMVLHQHTICCPQAEVKVLIHNPIIEHPFLQTAPIATDIVDNTAQEPLRYSSTIPGVNEPKTEPSCLSQNSRPDVGQGESSKQNTGTLGSQIGKPYYQYIQSDVIQKTPVTCVVGESQSKTSASSTVNTKPVSVVLNSLPDYNLETESTSSEYDICDGKSLVPKILDGYTEAIPHKRAKKKRPKKSDIKSLLVTSHKDKNTKQDTVNKSLCGQVPPKLTKACHVKTSKKVAKKPPVLTKVCTTPKYKKTKKPPNLNSYMDEINNIKCSSKKSKNEVNHIDEKELLVVNENAKLVGVKRESTDCISNEEGLVARQSESLPCEHNGTGSGKKPDVVLKTDRVKKCKKQSSVTDIVKADSLMQLVKNVSAVKKAKQGPRSQKGKDGTVAKKVFHKWRWYGESTMKAILIQSAGDKPVVRKCYQTIIHEDGDIVRVRDAVLLCSGPRKTDIPYVAKISAFWEEPESLEMIMSLLWYYRPEHTDAGRQPGDLDYEVFASKHRDENSVACIEDKCFILTYNQYCRYMAEVTRNEENAPQRTKVIPDACGDKHFPLPGHDVDADLVFLCRKVYDFRQKRLLKNPC